MKICLCVARVSSPLFSLTANRLLLEKRVEFFSLCVFTAVVSFNCEPIAFGKNRGTLFFIRFILLQRRTANDMRLEMRLQIFFDKSGRDDFLRVESLMTEARDRTEEEWENSYENRG